MNDEAAFLAAIRAAPKDSAPRLVFADWLDERGDPRCELVRIEEEMRRLPVYSDRFWQLKPRRNELRAQATPDWLEAMGYGTDCQPTFRHGVPDDWKGRWRLIREFYERWHRRPLGDVGGRADEIREVEARLGRTLPPSVREWVAFAHDVGKKDRVHAVLRELFEMQDFPGLPATSLVLQSEGDYWWAVRHADFSLPDPPVYGVHWDRENRDENTFLCDRDNPAAPTVASYFLGYVMGYTRGQGGALSTTVSEPAELVRGLKSVFPVQCCFEDLEIYEDDNLIVRLSTYRESGKHVVAQAAKAMAPEEVPAFLREIRSESGFFSGVFSSNQIVRSRDDPAGDIPF
jgi:uncharacterized protein (TIGR02996 family)